MRHLFRLAVWNLLLAAGMLAAFCTSTWLVPGGGLTWKDLLDYQEELERSDQLQEQLRVQREAAERRRADKIWVARQVIDGRMPLVEAAARFRTLNQQFPALWRQYYWHSYLGRDDVERSWHEVVRCVENLLADERARCYPVLDRLQEELGRLLDRASPHSPPSGPAVGGPDLESPPGLTAAAPTDSDRMPMRP
jgi:hypothetical protein